MASGLSSSNNQQSCLNCQYRAFSTYIWKKGKKENNMQEETTCVPLELALAQWCGCVGTSGFYNGLLSDFQHPSHF